MKGILGIALAATLAAATVPNLSGTWKLNAAKSRWGNKPKPTSILLHIRHNEPEISIDGTVADANEHTDSFQYSGTTDGKERTTPAGTVSIRRIDPYTFESTWHSSDGRYVERSRTTVSKDGRELTREVDLERPEGRLKWTEVYDKAG